MSRSIPDGRHSLTPRLAVDDPQRLVAFLKHAFGAAGEFTAERPTELRIGDSLIMIGATGPRPKTSSFFYLYVDDVEATYGRALEAGATSIEDPRDTPYGDRRAMLEDPCGNAWQIAARISSA